jgi:hypothetical protein
LGLLDICLGILVSKKMLFCLCVLIVYMFSSLYYLSIAPRFKNPIMTDELSEQQKIIINETVSRILNNMGLLTNEEQTALEKIIKEIMEFRELHYLEVRTETVNISSVKLVPIEESPISDMIERTNSGLVWKYNMTLKAPEKVWIVEYQAVAQWGWGPPDPYTSGPTTPWCTFLIQTVFLNTPEANLTCISAKPAT